VVDAREIEPADREWVAAFGCRRLWLITTNDNARAQIRDELEFERVL